jgi:hypothetical protein
MMPATDQGNWEIFVESVRQLPDELRLWAGNRDFQADVSARWPEQGSIVLHKGQQRLRIEVKDPAQGGGLTNLDRVWGLSISDDLFGGQAFMGRWPQGWRLFNPAKMAWEEVRLGPCLEHMLTVAFGSKAQVGKAGS